MPSTAKPNFGASAEPLAMPRPVKKILVAVDHEHHAAMAYALSLAGQLHAEVAVVYVFDPTSGVYSEADVAYLESLEQERSRAKEILQRVQQELPPNAHAFAVMREGDAAQEVIAAADEWDADMIVVGTHRRGAIARVMLGSTSQYIIKKGHRPVLLVDVKDEVVR